MGVIVADRRGGGAKNNGSDLSQGYGRRENDWMTEEYPHRIYLDTSVLQTIEQCSLPVWEGHALDPLSTVARKLRNAAEDIDALYSFFRVAERGAFQFIVSDATVAEVARSAKNSLLRWVLDVRQHSEICLAEEPPAPEASERAQMIDGSAFGYLGGGDRQLLREAMSLECDTFLTMERRLPKNAVHLRAKLGIVVVRPPELWAIVRRYPH